MNDDYFDLTLRTAAAAAEVTLGAMSTTESAPSLGRIEGTPGRNFASTDILELERRFNKLALGTQAMWELLRDRYGLCEDELKGKVLEIDLRDGRTDGKMNTLITECPKCRSKTNSRRPNCIMCGALIEKAHLFEF